MPATMQEVKVDSWAKVHEAVEQLKASAQTCKATGTHYVKIETNQGGVTSVRLASETKVA